MQSRTSSITEACCNTASGFVIAVLFTICWHYYFTTAIHEDVLYVLCLTVVSVVRSYVWRRVFNWWAAKRTIDCLYLFNGCAIPQHCKPAGKCFANSRDLGCDQGGETMTWRECLTGWVMRRCITISIPRASVISTFTLRGLLYVVTEDSVYVWDPDGVTLKLWSHL